MVDVLSDYIEAVDSVLEENPILTLEKLIGQKSNVTPGEIIQLSIKLKKNWNNYSKYGLEMGVILTEEECLGKELIYNYDFNNDISNIIKSTNKKSNLYYLNQKFEISEIISSDDVLTIEQCGNISKKINKILIHLGVRGVDIFVDGVIYSTDNFLSSYRDLMDVEKMLSIFDYEKLIHGFYIENVQYDPNKRYFLRKDDIPKEYHDKTLGKYPKLLKNKPEEYFEIDFVKYLKDHCKDAVIKEYITATSDRYDVLVLNENNEIYVFEIKWLGRSITTGMNVFDKYNSNKRAISGAYQLLDYVTNADTYKEYFLEFPIYCAILLIFDARDEDINEYSCAMKSQFR